MEKVKKLIAMLKHGRLTIAAAESCSGGYVAYLLTKVPGSSAVFKGGVISYALETKQRLFHIALPVLRKDHGVSAQICQWLAGRVRMIFKSDIGVAVVGFAGPAIPKGRAKGEVFIAVNFRGGTDVRRIVLKGDRDQIRKKASYRAILLAEEMVQQHFSVTKRGF